MILRKLISSLHIVCFMLSAQMLFAQTDTSIATQQFDVAALKEDFNTWRTALEKTHANLYLYNSKERMDVIFDSIYNNIKQPMTAIEFYGYITPLVAIIKDGHNYIHPNDALVEYYNKNELFFPFHVFYSTGKKLYIDMNLSGDSTIALGAEILSINSISVEKIWNELIRRQPRDGYNETYPTWILNNWFREYYSYVFGHPAKFDLEIKTPENTIIKKEVAALPKEMITAARKKKYPERKMVNENDKAIYVQFLDSDKTAVLDIKTFSEKMKKEYKQSFKKTITEFFEQVKNKQTQNLILDLRNNQGGAAEYGIHLVSYLLDKPFIFTKAYFAVNKLAASNTDNRLRNVKNGLIDLQKPNKNNFNGNLYVLINGGSFSCSGMVCAALEVAKRAVFIGEEAGGNKSVLTSLFSLKTKTTLPNTKIICDKPDYRTILTDLSKNDGHGVFPNYLLQPTITDIIKNDDVVLDYALKMIRK
ncbi:MAG: S41 family peptidase [Chitinophagales bacterium]